MTSSNTASELRMAADKIRKLVRAIEAPDLPDQSWHVEACASEERGECPCIVAQGRYSAEPSGAMQPLFYVADAETPECAAYIAAMGPTAGLALADWLDAEAAIWDAVETVTAEFGPRGLKVTTPLSTHEQALAVARAINGTAASGAAL